jgi:hypothetical protein
LQGRAVEGGTREAAIVIAIRNQAPALMGLALDIGLAGLALSVERVEFEIEIMLGRFAGVDRAALQLGNNRLHGLRSSSPRRDVAEGELPPGRCAATAGRDLLLVIRRRGRPLGTADDTSATTEETAGSLPLRSPKKRGPLQAVPVMARAMVERLA